ncbi:MAG: polyphosphate kinase 2 family protein [Verrucomicrobiota bacterium]
MPSRYLITPGSQADFSKINTKDDSLYPIGKEQGNAMLPALTTRLGELQELLYAEKKHKVLVILQAIDAGGKDGTIRKVFAGTDPAGVRVKSFKKPSENELDRDYLWRIHYRVPRKGKIAIFNRSHYEDILAVQVKNLAPKSVWSKRYEHINAFEKMLSDEGTTIVKLFLLISNKEQKQRLQARLDDPEKNWKFNVDDLDDRARWSEFMTAFQDMITRTSTDHAPWHVIPADRKWHRNLVVTQLMIKTLEAMNMNFPDIDFDPAKIVIE